MDIEQLIKENKGTVVDVRTMAEYRGGHVAGSINMELMSLPNRLEELRQLAQPLVLCCASGGRSHQATEYLKQMGFECYNGGSWLNINYFQSQSLVNK